MNTGRRALPPRLGTPHGSSPDDPSCGRDRRAGRGKGPRAETEGKRRGDLDFVGFGYRRWRGDGDDDAGPGPVPSSRLARASDPLCPAAGRGGMTRRRRGGGFQPTSSSVKLHCTSSEFPFFVRALWTKCHALHLPFILDYFFLEKRR